MNVFLNDVDVDTVDGLFHAQTVNSDPSPEIVTLGHKHNDARISSKPQTTEKGIYSNLLTIRAVNLQRLRL